ncbi:MAG: pyruvate formate lyase family protein [Phycisphaerae bacterium]
MADDLRDILSRTERRLLEAPDGICLDRLEAVTRIWKTRGDQPRPILRSLALGETLRTMRLDLQTNPVFAGNTSSGPRRRMLVCETGFGDDAQVAIEHPDLAGLAEAAVDEETRQFWAKAALGDDYSGCGGIGHLCCDYGMVVQRGLEWVIERIDETHGGGEPAERYRKAMRIACQAVIDWAGRYAEQAGQLAERSEDPALIVCYRRIASACRQVPARPARDLFEGLQAILLVHLAIQIEGQGMSVSIGGLDHILTRFDSEARQDPMWAAQLAGAFLLGVSANGFLGRASKTQAITLGGADANGQDRCNSLTEAFLDALELCPSIGDPHVYLRWHEGLCPKVRDRAMDLLAAGRSMPLLINDHAVVPGLERIGIAGQDAWDYAIIGCNEVGVPGRCCQTGFSTMLGYNELELLDQVMRTDPEGFESAGQVLDAWSREVFRQTVARIPARWQRMDWLVENLPMPLSSACFTGCIEAGDDLLRARPYARIPGLFLRGTTNATNALAAVDRLVYREKRWSLGDLLAGIDRRDAAVLEAVAGCPKWGRDDPEADAWMQRICSSRTEALTRAAKRHGLAGIAICHVVRSLHHLDGLGIGPTADGRSAGQPVADSLGPAAGTEPVSPVETLTSLMKLDAAGDFPGIYNLNLTLPSRQASRTVVASLVETFFRGGGQQLQLASLSSRRLRQAMAEPEAHRQIVVRVAGFNARFVELSQAEKREILDRATAAENTRT